MPLRILVVDDTVIYRKIISEILRDIDGVEVVGTAINGELALEKIHDLKPDLVTLDLEMPLLNGVEVLRRLRAERNPAGIIMLSAFTSQGAAATTEALRLGAFDFVLKPNNETFQANAELLRQQLAERIAAFAHSRDLILPAPKPIATTTPALAERTSPGLTTSRIAHFHGDSSPAVIVLGISTGGPEALNKVVPRLPAGLAAPLFIVQHMPPLFTKSLADDLNQRSRLKVTEAAEGQLVRPGQCVIAPGGKQMKIERTELGSVVRITDDPAENSCRPAVDYLFRSAVQHYGSQVLGVIMTGMGSDGTAGCRLLKQQGATVLAQDKESCVVFGMPCTVIAEGLADRVVSLDQMAAEIHTIVKTGCLSLAAQGACS